MIQKRSCVFRRSIVIALACSAMLSIAVAQGAARTNQAFTITAVSGSAYSFLDRGARKSDTVRYWIQAVNLDGSRGWHGPTRR